MIESVVVVAGSGVLVAKYYAPWLQSTDKRAQWIATLHKLTQAAQPLPDALQVAVHESESRSAQHLSTYRDKFVVYTAIGELVIFWSGSAEHDELLCRLSASIALIVAVSELMTSFLQVLKQVCKKGVSEAAVLDSYAKICLILDAMVHKVFSIRISVECAGNRRSNRSILHQELCRYEIGRSQEEIAEILSPNRSQYNDVGKELEAF